MGMRGIEEEIEFGGDDDAGDLEDGRGGASATRGGIGAPVLRKRGRGKTLNEVRRDGDGNGDIVAKEFFGIQMDKDFEGGERLRLRRVNDGATRGVPAAAKEARSFTSKGDLCESAMDDSPGDGVHRKTATLTGRRRVRAGR